jgi:hypothetical protein
LLKKFIFKDMTGSLIITFDERVNGRGGAFFDVTVNGQPRNTHYTDSRELYTTNLNVGDVCTICMSGQTQYTEVIGVIRRDYTTDAEDDNMGIYDNTITNQTGGPGLCVTFTATTVSNTYNFEYRVDLSYVQPTPTPTPTPTPLPVNVLFEFTTTSIYNAWKAFGTYGGSTDLIWEITGAHTETKIGTPSNPYPTFDFSSSPGLKYGVVKSNPTSIQQLGWAQNLTPGDFYSIKTLKIYPESNLKDVSITNSINFESLITTGVTTLDEIFIQGSEAITGLTASTSVALLYASFNPLLSYINSSE